MSRLSGAAEASRSYKRRARCSTRSRHAYDSLAIDWSALHAGKLAWLNPPFADIAPWVERRAAVGTRMKIIALLPAAVGSNWFAGYVHRHALVLALSPRVVFVGHRSPYPKDLIVAAYGFGVDGFDCWRWDR